MRILGIDCGTERTGFGVVDTDGTRHRLIGAGVIRTSPRQQMAERLCEIARGLRGVIADFRPERAAVEEVFHASNSQSALKLAHVRGVALATLADAGIMPGEYSALEVKMSVVGYGRAEKAQVQLMVRSLLRLETPEEHRAVEKEDAADALAVAICHATHLASKLRAGLAS